MPKPNEPTKKEKPRTATEKSEGLKNWLGGEGVKYDYKRDSWSQETPEGGRKTMGWQEVLDLITTSASDNYMCAQQRALAVLRMWARKERDAFVAEIQDRIIGWTPTATEAKQTWDKWINAICEEGGDLSKVIMQHWIWQVRRKLLQATVTDHMCPVWCGGSGSGKSTEIRELLRPVADIASEQSLTQLVDERHYVELSRTYIIYLDEMAQARKANREMLKALISAPYVWGHIFHSQRREYIYQATTLIGSSNNNVPAIIKDSTSARRYWEVRCKKKLDWKALDTLDRRILWGSIDPTKPSPLDADPAVKKEIQKLQHDHLRDRLPVEEWAAERKIKSGKHACKTRQLYASYTTWCGAVKLAPTNKIAFAKQLRDTLRLSKGREKGERVWYVAEMPEEKD